MLEKAEGATKNGQSRDTGNSGYTRHKSTTNKNNTKTQHNTENLDNEHHIPHQNEGGGETDTRCLLELDGNLVSLYFLIVRRYVYGWHNPIQRILEL